ncbi:hypothetical protein ACJMK2_020499 [Sinanodonta woodiana]|uniref:Uncharacterized protein n=1 Tax=Sinanodonta woodiana TaxID=1069815 RepID=A0ABD3TZB0_SINWO
MLTLQRQTIPSNTCTATADHANTPETDNTLKHLHSHSRPCLHSRDRQYPQTLAQPQQTMLTLQRQTIPSNTCTATADHANTPETDNTLKHLHSHSRPC